jgi:hypothetical protein
VFVSFANSGFKIVITAKIKTVNKKKGGRQVCGFCDKQDSLKGSQLYRKEEIGSVPSQTKETITQGSVLFSDKEKDHAKEKNSTRDHSRD